MLQCYCGQLLLRKFFKAVNYTKAKPELSDYIVSFNECMSLPCAAYSIDVHTLVRWFFHIIFQILVREAFCFVEDRETGKAFKICLCEGFMVHLYCTFGRVKAESYHCVIQPVRPVSPVCNATSCGYESFIWQWKDKRARSLKVSTERKSYSHSLSLDHRLQWLSFVS